MGLLFVYLQNTSHQSVVLRSVDINGPGMGSVVQVLDVQVAPLTYGGRNTTPISRAVIGGLYGSNSPVFFMGTYCHVQSLARLRGYVMRPNARVRLWIILRAMRGGSFRIPAHVVSYSVGGHLYTEAMRSTVTGSVARHAKAPTHAHATQECLLRTGAKVLVGYRPYRRPAAKRG